MANQAVINASPLIFFSRGQQMELLRHFAQRIFVPEPVAEEIRMKGSQDITVKVLDSTPWLEVLPAVPVPETILEWGQIYVCPLLLISQDSRGHRSLRIKIKNQKKY